MVGSRSCPLFFSCTSHGVFCASCWVRVLQCSQALRARHTPGIITQYDRLSTPVAEDALSASPQVWSLCAQSLCRRVHFRHFCTQPCRSSLDDSRGHHTSAGMQQCTRWAVTPSWASPHHRLVIWVLSCGFRAGHVHVLRTTFSTGHSNQRDTCQRPCMLCLVLANTTRVREHSAVLPGFHGCLSCTLCAQHGPACSFEHSASTVSLTTF